MIQRQIDGHRAILGLAEAFMLSVPLPADRDFDVERFVTTDAERRGRDLFFSVGCSSCHSGGPLTGNLSFNTGVAKGPVNTIPPPECDPPCAPLGQLEAGGERTFDVPTLFGLKNTAPFFHDNSATTLRDAVAFYTSLEFNSSPGATSPHRSP